MPTIRFNRALKRTKKQTNRTKYAYPVSSSKKMKFFNNEITYIIVAHGRGMSSKDVGFKPEIYSTDILPLDAFSFGALVEDNCVLTANTGETLQTAAARMLKNTLYRKHLIFSKCKILNKKTNSYWFPNMYFYGSDAAFLSTICRIDERNNVTYFPLTPNTLEHNNTDLQTILLDILVRENRITVSQPTMSNAFNSSVTEAHRNIDATNCEIGNIVEEVRLGDFKRAHLLRQLEDERVMHQTHMDVLNSSRNHLKCTPSTKKINVIFNTCMVNFEEVLDTKLKSDAFNCIGKNYAAGIRKRKPHRNKRTNRKRKRCCLSPSIPRSVTSTDIKLDGISSFANITDITSHRI